MGVAKIQAGADSGSVRFGERASVDPLLLIGLVEDDAEHYRLDGPFKLRFSWDTEPTAEKRIDAIEALLLRLGAGEPPKAAA